MTEPAVIADSPVPLNRLSDIPVYRQVLSRPGGPVPLTPNRLREMAAIEVSPKVAVILLVSSARGSIHASELADRIRRGGYRIESTLAITPGLLTAIYQKDDERDAATDKDIDQSEAQRDFRDVVRQAALAGASDIHITAGRHRATVRYRVHGEMRHVTEWSVAHAERVCKSVFDVHGEAKAATWDPRVAQDAAIPWEDEGLSYKLRYAHAPASPYGFHVVLRLLPVGRHEKAVPLHSLGFSESQIRDIELLTARPNGVTIIAGETGSGKSTTLANMLRRTWEQYEHRITIITVEDPPEYEIEGAIQCPVVRSKEDKVIGRNPFAEMVRSAMRRDPDVILIGETRDVETARAMVQATQSGHKVFTSLHAGSGIGIIPRLENIGVDRDIMSTPGFLAGLIFQRLLPVLCAKCARPFTQDAVAPDQAERIVRAARSHLNQVRLRGPGCSACNEGVVGRTVCAEVLRPSEAMLDLIAKRRDREALALWVKEGGQSSLDTAVLKMREGIVSPVDVEHKCGLLDESNLYDK